VGVFLKLSDLSLNLDGKTAVVTGANRGLGKAISLALAKAGANVVCAARSEKELQEVTEEIKSYGRQTMHVVVDISKPKEVEELVERSVNKFGSVQILVNNAGIFLTRPVLETTEEEWRKTIDINLTGTFLCTKAFGRQMIANEYGKIINISSSFGLVGVSSHSAYCATKAALIELTKCLAIEWAKYNINVNSIAPGFFDTTMASQVYSVQKLKDVTLASIPLKRIADPKELGALAVYLASPASDYMTGETIVIDGGFTVK